MDNPATKIAEFVAFVAKYIKGDEKGEAQVFCDRLFQAFGHRGIMEAGETVTAPGLPLCVTDAAAFITDDCIQPPAL